MDITLKNLQKKILLNSHLITRITQAILRHENVCKADLSIVFVTHQRIRSLNRKYLRRDHVTDVLAFELGGTPSLKGNHERNGRNISGEIIISADAARANTKIYSTSLSREVILYVIHGILHLLGLNDHKPVDIKKMREREQELLSYVGPKIKNVARPNGKLMVKNNTKQSKR